MNPATAATAKSIYRWFRPFLSGRAANPSQPLTVGVWFNNEALNEFQLTASDVITFHHYWEPEKLEREIAKLKVYGRTVLCTEWMARTCGSLVSTNLPVFTRENAGCFNWGLVAGKTNTIYQWKELNSVHASIDAQVGPEVWFHDLLCADGTPYDRTEIELFKKYTGVQRLSSSGVTFPELAPN